MFAFRFLNFFSLLLLSFLLSACGGGGGGGGGSRDVFTAGPAVIDTSGPNSFLLFPNPLVLSNGTFQTDSTAYAQAYYAAIDPMNQKDTLAKWMQANGFSSGTGTQVTVVFGDQRDLGYGRRMTARQNVDGTIAVMVQNYVVEPATNYTYSTVNLDAAVVQDQRWHIATNAIEYSPGPGGSVRFVKYFTFDPTTGVRELTANMDGRGEKAMPSPCISCHGGRADPLTPPNMAGNQLFPLVQNTLAMARGDVQGRMQPLEVDTFDFNSAFGLTRASQEAAFKTINQFVLCTYPKQPGDISAEDACRPAATTNEWQGTAAAVIKNAYGGNGLPNATFSDTYLPNSWLVAGQTPLYRDTVVPACRICHLLRGTGTQADIDFDTYQRFQGFADRIKIHTYDRGNMPLAFLLYDRFFSTAMAGSVATFLQGEGQNARDGNGAVLVPGRPIADPDPSRTVLQGATTLSGLRSLFSTGYQWSFVSNPGGATLTNPTAAQPTFNATVNGTYILQLVTSRSGIQSTPAQLTLVVNNALTPAPAAIRFADIKAVLQGGTCVGCHVSAGNAPIIFSNIDRNGDTLIDATDDLWFYTELRGRINFTEIVASPLLRKPSGNHHSGGQRDGFDTSLAPGQLVGGQNGAGRGSYDLFLNWILNGAPQ